ncbi:MAG: U32 family peptidase, partial [Candidatus Gastranaerophilales bacterium]|nr:U32 family peptidase [Candidatus Gastranaerophilales bacterium]
MKNIKIFAPISSTKDIEVVKKTSCRNVFASYKDFIAENSNKIDEIIDFAHKSDFEFYLNFTASVQEKEIDDVKKLLSLLLKTKVDGILVNNFTVLDFLKLKKVPFKVIIDSGLNIHNLSGIDFVEQFLKIDTINITEEIYIKNLEKMKKYKNYKLSIDSDNLPWLAEEIQKKKLVESIIIKGKFDSEDDLIDSIVLIEKILQKPKIFKNQKLPFKHLGDSLYRTNHFSGEFLSSESRDFKFKGNIKSIDWEYTKMRLKKNVISQEMPDLTLRLTSFEQIKILEKYIKKLKFNPVKSIEYGEILNTSDLAKSSFNSILEHVKNFCAEQNILLNLSTPNILIERDFDRVYEYVKLLCVAKPYPASIVINNIGYWWAIINDSDFDRISIELGKGLNLSLSQSMLTLANQQNISAIDLSNFKDINGIKNCIKKIKNKIPKRKLTIAGNIKVPSSGLCPLNNDSAILSRLSCKAPCHKGNWGIINLED